MKKLLIAGTLTLEREDEVLKAMKELKPGEVIICHGDDIGSSSVAREYARRAGIDQIRCPANWQHRGENAGPWRNRLMLRFFKPDEVWAFPLEKCSDTKDMMEIAEVAGVPVRVFI